MAQKTAKVALVQEPPVILNLARTIDKLEKITKKSAENGAEIVVFPETWIPGYPIWLDEAPEIALWNHPPAKRLFGYLFENSLELYSREFERVCAAAQENSTYLVVGANERMGGTLYNTTIYLSPGGKYKIHRKLVPTYTERLVWGVGDGSTLNILETKFGNLGGLICWEHWMPLARAAMHSRNEALHTAQFPTVHERHQIASRQYAFEGQCFVLASGCVVSKNDVLDGFLSLETGDKEVFALLNSMKNEKLQRGGSAVIAPDISYVAEPVFDDPSTVYADLDLSLINESRLLLDTDGHYSRPDVFELRINTKENKNVIFET
ncbi:MAG: carbon-nitrogen hydrolase family protein [Pyrinomonadaceae bacterium]|nr:carbon-nitrogen hydrolase family protein [Pyrinomonadaceae bacterium]